MSYKIGGGAIRLHNYVAQVLVLFLRALGLSVAYEPTNIFAEIRRPNGQGLDHRRPDILVHNPLSEPRSEKRICNYRLRRRLFTPVNPSHGQL